MKILAIKQWLLFAVCATGTTACYDDETPVKVNNVITSISHTPAKLTADGESQIRIAITLPSSVVDSQKKVTLYTTTGTFLESQKNSVTVPAFLLNTSEGAFIAYATLISPAREGMVSVLVTVQDYTKEYMLTLERAYPESLRLTTSTLNLKTTPDSEATLTIELKRFKGIPTAGHPVSLTVQKANGDPLNGFRNKILVSDTMGKCVNYFSVSDPALIGQKLTAIAKTKDAQGNDLPESKIELTIIPN